MLRYGHEAVMFRKQLAAFDFLSFANDGYRRFADVLRQRDDQHRRKRELPYRQAGRRVLRLRRVDAVTEGREAILEAAHRRLL